MYTKILVPLDGSKTAENVLPYARTLASGLKMPVEAHGGHRYSGTGNSYPG